MGRTGLSLLLKRRREEEALSSGRTLPRPAHQPPPQTKKKKAHKLRPARTLQKQPQEPELDADADQHLQSGENAYEALKAMFFKSNTSSMGKVLRRRQLQERGDSDSEHPSDVSGDGHKTESELEEDNNTDASSIDLNKPERSENGTSAHSKQETTIPVDSRTPVPDYWEQHLGHVLTVDDVAQLTANLTNFRDIDDPDYQGVWPHARWQVSGGGPVPPAPQDLKDYGVKERLVNQWREVVEAQFPGHDAATSAAGPSGRPSSSSPSGRPQGSFASARQRVLFALMNSYRDVLYPAYAYPTSTHMHDNEVQDAVLLHCLNHVAKTADCIKRNNERLKASQQGEGGAGEGGLPRDQGFTRPKVLLLLPQRNLAFRCVLRLVSLAIKETRTDSVQNKEKFVDQFTADVDEDGDSPSSRRQLGKPAEHRALFHGNLDDHFRMGIKLTRGAVRLFSDLLDSDIIVASPLALATKIAEAAKNDDEGDFLSSIEILVVDRADVITMQNWAHMEVILAALNRLPRAHHGSDIMRVREWYLSGQARHYRQTLLLSSFLVPEMNAMFSRDLSPRAGRARLKVAPPGVLQLVVPQVQQLFSRFSCASPAASGDARFDVFTRQVWPRLRQAGGSGLLLFVPSYFDFVRLRNWMLREDASFVALSEYSTPGDTTRSRARFFHGQRQVMVYTERSHFYHRYHIRGVKDIVFYSLPLHAHFYSELLNLLEASSGSTHATVTALYCKYDALQLERVVGSSRARKMLCAESSTFMFC